MAGSQFGNSNNSNGNGGIMDQSQLQGNQGMFGASAANGNATAGLGGAQVNGNGVSPTGFSAGGINAQPGNVNVGDSHVGLFSGNIGNQSYGPQHGNWSAWLGLSPDKQKDVTMDDQGNATLTPHQDSPWSLSSLSKPSTPQRDLDRLKNIGKIGDLFKGFKL